MQIVQVLTIVKSANLTFNYMHYAKIIIYAQRI